MNPQSIEKVRELTRNLSPQNELNAMEIQKLMEIGPITPQLLRDYSDELRRKSNEMQKLAKEIRERMAISELVDSLSHEDEKSIDLLRSALLIARIDNEHFDLNDYLKKRIHLLNESNPNFQRMQTIHNESKSLFDNYLMRWDSTEALLDFHHRSNSYMNEVIDDREGLPITLSVLFMELAKRLELKVAGLGLPGHFLTIYKSTDMSEDESNSLESKISETEIIIDSFGGKIIDREQAAQLTGLALEDLSFEPSSKKEIIKRMLRNLLQVAEREKDSNSQIRYLDAILAISPEDRYLRAQRAMTHYIIEDFEKALEDIDFLLESDPKSPENEPLRVIRNRLINQGAASF